MKVEADVDLCQGHQMCQGEAATVFGFDADEDVVVLLDAHPDDSLRDAVAAAVKYCPAMALTLRD
ncbi:ferredoxin [Nocardioides alcanivorans]|uniref:ferredoxin n=1 Tax=Nocardioides alcanivorans TaxID=2897352 RepID=UPI001F164B1F|nr:ferredoxin [Nocardioides alcanivorans]